MKRFLQFCIAGSLGFITDASITLGLIQWGISAYLARLPAFGIAVLVTWIWNVHHTFSDRQQGKDALGFWRYCSSQIIGMSLNISLYWLLIYHQLLPLSALVIATAASLWFNWLAANHWVFKS